MSMRRLSLRSESWTRAWRAVPDWAIVALFCGLILLQTIPSLLQKSATFDEVMRQWPGWLHLTRAEYRIHTEHPPLVKMLATLPLLTMEIHLPPIPSIWTLYRSWEYARDFLYKANDADLLLTRGRLAVLPLTLLLGAAVFYWARELFGRSAAIGALFLYSLEPNILAHGRLINTDLAVTCFLFLTVYAFYRALQHMTIPRLALTGLALGAALITKYSAVIAVPFLAILAGWTVVSGRPVRLAMPHLPPRDVEGWARKCGILLGALLLIGGLAYGIIWAAYQFQFKGGTDPRYTYVNTWEAVLPDNPVLEALVTRANQAHLLPEAYLLGLSSVLKKMKRINFLMGEISTDGWWYYFPVTLALKTPIPLLILAAGGIAWIVRTRGTRQAGPVAAFLLIPPFLYFTLAMTSSLNIGHRHILPIYPFLFVAASALIPWVLTRGRALKGLVAVLGLWYLASAVWIHPHYLAYFNELAGGPGNGYRYLVDSNLDWGQDLKGLKDYMDDLGIDRIWLSYLGTASPSYYGISYNSLPSYPSIPPTSVRRPTPYVAISATNLQGVYLGPQASILEPFRHMTPIAKIGYSIFVYRLDSGKNSR